MTATFPTVFELNFDESSGALGPVACASSFCIPEELLPFTADCLPADSVSQQAVSRLLPVLGMWSI